MFGRMGFALLRQHATSTIWPGILHHAKCRDNTRHSALTDRWSEQCPRIPLATSYAPPAKSKFASYDQKGCGPETPST